ncbi:MAG: repressor LexA [SAR202 cluster bacterium]|jgi:repressor LexA|nr:repressor LexA [Chloroflexota bacterium]MQF84084.1 repressor LexA [SAR202 cluster bacterium]MEC7919512.1 transcriptional repressor LexA [Chloroflexota bacterium]MEC9098549.1 transcriptional repressor LexA [Chloroflexota bacterium]MED5236948.1 transcriptional repressor LexA [Chloroflexota bacterium]|tara:strand:+ start:716 stop:1363 length:648 start_codon:yes stop_codon:yes gene_type:complete
MRNSKPLTEKQKDILNFIETYIEEFGYPPSIRDIQNNCDISSTSVVKYNLDRLQEKGLMNRDSEISRSISLTNSEKSQTIKVPVLGTITAGQPFPMVEDSRWDVDELESIDLPDNFSYIEDKIFALKVSGYSMVDALIGDGDTIILEKTNKALNGEMVAAKINSENETTLKRIFIEGNNTRLQPENPLMDSMYFPSKDVSILGKVVAVWRYMPNR